VKPTFAADLRAKTLQSRYRGSLTGRIVFDAERLVERNRERQLFIVGVLEERPTQITNGTAQVYTPSWSPDCSRIVFGSTEYGDIELITIAPDGSARARLTTTPFNNDVDPNWSRDGRKIVYSSASGFGNGSIVTINSDGTGRTVLNRQALLGFPSFSPDGSRILFSGTNRTDLASFEQLIDTITMQVMNADGTGVRPIPIEGRMTGAPVWSPQGSLLAFNIVKDNQADVYTIRLDGTGLTKLTSGMDSESSATWSPDGRLLAYVVSGPGLGPQGINVMNADGSDSTRIVTVNGWSINRLAWC
jgi:Tol biopolymer transport system component